MPLPANEFEMQVIKALENPEYDWRTIQGLASELHASESEVVAALALLRDTVVRTEDSQGRHLFTTRSHYEKTHGFADKLLSALSDRIVA